MSEHKERPVSIPDLDEADTILLLRALAGSSNRVERVVLSDRMVWMKRYGSEQPTMWLRLHALLARLIPFPFLRPSPLLGARDMLAREMRRITLSGQRGFPAPHIVYSSDEAMVLQHVGETLQQELRRLRTSDPQAHDGLLVRCAEALGRFHAAGLCHGRPHPRDMFQRDGAIGFMDFEEEPEAVMPLDVAQARDIWLLFLQIASLCQQQETCDRAYRAWASAAPAATAHELRRMMRVLGRFLPLARLIGRIQMGSDLRRFIMATDYLMNVSPTIAAHSDTGKAGQDDRTGNTEKATSRGN